MTLPRQKKNYLNQNMIFNRRIYVQTTLLWIPAMDVEQKNKSFMGAQFTETVLLVPIEQSIYWRAIKTLLSQTDNHNESNTF